MQNNSFWDDKPKLSFLIIQQPINPVFHRRISVLGTTTGGNPETFTSTRCKTAGIQSNNTGGTRDQPLACQSYTRRGPRCSFQACQGITSFYIYAFLLRFPLQLVIFKS